jgi:hypothetical protein
MTINAEFGFRVNTHEREIPDPWMTVLRGIR